VDMHVNSDGDGYATTATVENPAGTYSVSGSGADIWTWETTDTAPDPDVTTRWFDEFQFYHQSYSPAGDFQVVARVTSLALTGGTGTINEWAKAGIMVRQTAVTPNPATNAEKGALFAGVFVTPTHGASLQWRSTAGEWCGDRTPAAYPAPLYVKLVRRGNTFYGYCSSNGTFWVFLGTTSVTFANPVYVGLAVTAHNDDQLVTGVFTDVSWGAVQSPHVPTTQTPATPVGAGDGLTGEYWNVGTTTMPPTAMPTTTPDATQAAANINFNWGNGNVTPLAVADGAVARWTGYVEPRYTGHYTFYTNTDDGVRLYVGGSLIIDHWVNQGPTVWGGSVMMTAGTQYQIVMEYYENGGDAVAQLYWESDDGQAFEVIPGTQFSTTLVAPPPPPPGADDGNDRPNGDDWVGDWCGGSLGLSSSPGALALLPALFGLGLAFRRRRR